MFQVVLRCLVIIAAMMYKEYIMPLEIQILLKHPMTDTCKAGKLPHIYVDGESARSMSNGVISHPIDGPCVIGTVGSEPVAAKSRTFGFGGSRPEVPLPLEASSTLFVEGLPANCTRREVSHIFRPFVGYKEAGLVIKESHNPGGNPLVLCFVDFLSPAHAPTVMHTLQGVGSK